MVAIQYQHPGLEEPLGMFNRPVRPTLQECGVPFAGIEGQPAAFVTDPGYLLVRIADVVEVQFPMGVGLVGQVLGFAGDGKHLATRGPDLVDDPCFHVAPQLGATGGSPEAAVKEQHHKGMLGHDRVQPGEARSRGRIQLGLGLALLVLTAAREGYRPPVARTRDVEGMLLAAVATTKDQADLIST